MKDSLNKALKNKVKRPEITLNQKVFDGIKGLGIDSEIEVKMKLKVNDIGRSVDYDIPYEEGKERPKILQARFEVLEAKKL